ncbi:MAG: glycosyltransferase family A protein [Pseudomonadota bacterium]
MPPLVSIIIPTYNRASALKRAIAGVMDQTYPFWELLVVDDGSTDDTRTVLKQFSQVVRYFYQDNAGAAAARNLGIRNSRGEYIAFLDSDDWWLPEKLGKQVQYLQAQEDNVAMIGCGAYWYNVASGENISFHATKEITYDNLVDCDTWPAGTSGVLIRRSCFEIVGLFDEALRRAQDWDMWLRIGQRFHIRCVVEPLVYISIQHTCRPEKSLRILKDCQFRVIAKNMSGVARRRAMSWMYLDLARLAQRAGASRVRILWFLWLSFAYCQSRLPWSNRPRMAVMAILPDVVRRRLRACGSDELTPHG